MGLSVLDIMKTYNIDIVEAQNLQFKIIMIMLTIITVICAIILIVKLYNPKLYNKLKKLNIV